MTLTEARDKKIQKVRVKAWSPYMHVILDDAFEFGHLVNPEGNKSMGRPADMTVKHVIGKMPGLAFNPDEDAWVEFAPPADYETKFGPLPAIPIN